MNGRRTIDSVMRSRWALPVAGALLAACGQHAPAPDASPAAALMREGDSIAVPAASPLRKALQVAPAAETTIERPISVPGVIEADPARLVKIVPPIGGRIEHVYKGLGDAVRAGEPLLTLDSADLAQATSDATKAQAALALADRALTRQQDLVTAEIAARKDLEQAQSDRAQAQSEARRAQSRLAQLGSALGRGNGRSYTLAAPISGHVIDLTGAQGGFWNDTNAPLMTVADLSKVWLTASVQEKDLAAVFVGQQAKIVLNAYPGEVLTGPVAYVGQVLDADTRTVKVRVALANTAGKLRPGMFASAVFSGASHEAITVPASALIQDGFNTRVFVERAPWTFEARKVTTGAQIGSQVEIAAGLKLGERIVVKDGVLLND
jgi:membrane fusion protein, heavy metal efflux system